MNSFSADVERVRFLFDPTCPWAYRASLWVREVAEVLPLEVEWEPFSLEYVNRSRLAGPELEKARRTRHAMRLMARAFELEGHAGIDALYLELGKAVHERKEDLSDEAVLARVLSSTGFSLALLAETRKDEQLDAKLEKSYARAEQDQAFGVPTLYINENPRPFYGPLISSVPSGYEAGKLWEYISGLTSLPYFYELKRSR